MIIVITITEYDEITGKEKLIVDHGVDVYTDNILCLPAVHPAELGAVFDPEFDEWVLEG